MTTAIFGPFSALYVCGAPGLLLPLAVGGSLAVYLNSENVPGEPGNADVASAGACSALVGAYFCLLLYATCWRDLEAYFSTFPWKQHTQPVTSKGGVRTYLTRCPFTGARRGAPAADEPPLPSCAVLLQLTPRPATCLTGYQVCALRCAAPAASAASTSALSTSATAS
jgi:hypothetical protein